MCTPVLREQRSLIRIETKFFTFFRNITDPPYDRSIYCSADHLKRVNSNSQYNFHRFNSCHAQSSCQKYESLLAPPLVSNLSNDFKISLRSRIPCSNSLNMLLHLTLSTRTPCTHILIIPRI